MNCPTNSEKWNQVCEHLKRGKLEKDLSSFLFVSISSCTLAERKGKTSQTSKPLSTSPKFSCEWCNSAIQCSFSVFLIVLKTQNRYESSVLHFMTTGIWKIQTNTLAVLSVKYMKKYHTQFFFSWLRTWSFIHFSASLFQVSSGNEPWR